MSHIPSSAQPGGSTGTLPGRVVTYTATGIEGTSFLVPIGATMPSTSYAITWSPSGVTNVPVVDLPTGGANRATTYFRVQTATTLTAGEVLTFVLFG